MKGALKHPKAIDQAANCGYFWKESDKIHSLLHTILVRDKLTGKNNQRVAKYLIQISIRGIDNDLIKSKNEGGINEVWSGNKLLVSDTGLRYIIPVNVKRFTPRYKQMCGCIFVAKQNNYNIVLMHREIDNQKVILLIEEW